MIAFAKKHFQSGCFFHQWETEATFTKMRGSPTFGSSSDDEGMVSLAWMFIQQC